MSAIRIIPRLDIKGPNLVKGVHLEGLRVLGPPDEFADYYYRTGADELLFVDIVASLYGRNNIGRLIEETAKRIFIPLTVGGGIRTLEDIRRVLRAGADKVAINTAAVKSPEFIREAARAFGSSTIVVSIEFMKNRDGRMEVYTDNGRERTGLDPIEWAKRVSELGAGELLLTSISQEGTGNGFDLEWTKRIAESVSIPVIACGGAGRAEHVERVIQEGSIRAVAAASIFHYEYLQKKNSKEKTTEPRESRKDSWSRIVPCGMPTLKMHLKSKNIDCRVS